MIDDLNGKTVAVLGLAYKARIFDTRDSPSLRWIEHLLAELARVKAHDPDVDRLDSVSVEICPDIESCLAGSDCCIITTREESFRRVSRHLSVMNNSAIIDMVRLLDPKLVCKRALYAAVGLGLS